MLRSLVGSEMCIRDSLHAGAALRKLQGARGEALLPRSFRQARPPDRTDAVSYTHLTLPTIYSV